MRRKVCLAVTLIVVSMGAVPATAEAVTSGQQAEQQLNSVICRIMPWLCR